MRERDSSSVGDREWVRVFTNYERSFFCGTAQVILFVHMKVLRALTSPMAHLSASVHVFDTTESTATYYYYDDDDGLG